MGNLLQNENSSQDQGNSRGKQARIQGNFFLLSLYYVVGRFLLDLDGWNTIFLSILAAGHDLKLKGEYEF